MTTPKTNPAHGLVAHRNGRLHLRSHHTTEADARRASEQTVDPDALQVMPINLALATNGNVQLWTVR